MRSRTTTWEKALQVRHQWSGTPPWDHDRKSLCEGCECTAAGWQPGHGVALALRVSALVVPHWSQMYLPNSLDQM